MEEYFYILAWLQHGDKNTRIILGFKLLLLAESRCQKKWRGGSSRVCCTCGYVAEHLPNCSPTLLERLTWAIYDGMLSPGSTPHLEDSKSWWEIIKYLADKAFKGLCTRCPTHMSAMFKDEEQTEWLEGNRQLHSVVTVPPSSTRGGEASQADATANSPCRGSPGSYRTCNLPTCVLSPLMGSGLSEHHVIAPLWEEKGHLRGDLHPKQDALKWMKERQHSYTDDQLDFWCLLQPLTDGSEKATWCLACRLLCLALVFGCQTSHLPSDAFNSECQLLAKGLPQTKQMPAVAGGIHMCATAGDGGGPGLNLDHQGTASDERGDKTCGGLPHGNGGQSLIP